MHSLNVVASSVPGQPWTCEPSTLPNLQNVELRMIDVTHQCIVPASPGYQYVALSYVWASKSKEDRLVLNKQTYPRLVETGGLAAHKVDVPQTFRDAITLVNRLGLKYLWIDALCIQQDDPAVLEAQMSSMDHRITRSAAEYQGGKSVAIHEHVSFTTTRRPPWSKSEISPLSTRGWTLQEDILSKRFLSSLHTKFSTTAVQPHL